MDFNDIYTTQSYILDIIDLMPYDMRERERERERENLLNNNVNIYFIFSKLQSPLCPHPPKLFIFAFTQV